MSSWDGYVADIPYVSEYYANLSPHKLNLACLIHGINPPSFGMGSAYLELGCGFGITLLALAAANPEAQFVGVDYLGEHIQKAKRLASVAQLKNIKFLKAEFGDLAMGKPGLGGPYSYIVAHGVYTWISRRKRIDIQNILKKYLAKNGLLFLGYNALPGWTNILPAQHLLRELSKTSGVAGSEGVSDAISRMKAMISAGAKNLEPMQNMANLMVPDDDLSLPYIVHEYLHDGWEPMYLQDVARDMKKVGLNFVGPVNLLSSLPFLIYTEDQRSLMDSFEEPLQREQMGDYFRPTFLREDIFIRGGEKLDQGKSEEMLAKLMFAGTGRESLKIGKNEGTFTATLDENIYRPMLEALKEGPRTAQFLMTLSQSKKRQISLSEIVSILLGVRLAVHLPQPGLNCPRSAFKLTGALLEDLIAQKLKTTALIITPKRGDAMSVDLFELAVYMAICKRLKPGDREFVEQVWSPFFRAGQALVEDGKIIKDEATKSELLTSKAIKLLQQAMPKWKAFGALPD